MDNTQLDHIAPDADLRDILLGGRAFFENQGGAVFDVFSDDRLAPEHLRIEAVNAMVESGDINYYPYLRQAAMTDPSAAVREAIRNASNKMEEIFGEEACIEVDKAYTGELKVKNSEEAHISGNFLSANLNDFR